MERSEFENLRLIQSIPPRALETYRAIMAHKSGSSKDVLIITKTHANARTLLSLVAKGADVKVNAEHLFIIGANGTRIYFTPLSNITEAITGRHFKDIQFR